MPTPFDPQLHILRSIANSIADPKERHEAQSARHNLFSALATEDYGATLDWLEALEVAFHSVTTPLDGTILASADRAIATIRQGVAAASGTK